MDMMSENILSLVVPIERELREEIRRKTDLFFLKNTTVPPVSYKRLAGMADKLLAINDWDKNYKAFVMVCCGNAVWRSVVVGIPYNRRMLLLPQCLRNSSLCNAAQDELGLLCSECGNCRISGFLREAEDLGYLTIVSEGTTVASRLVESGKVDAIVGVGCMEVLQKIFKAVNKYSVPAIGIPLLSCGCIDTTSDEEWIKEEILNFDKKENFHLLNLNNLKAKIDSLFTEDQISHLLNLSQSPADDIVLELLLAGGKRIRPLLTALSYEAYCVKPDFEVFNHLVMSIECFHKASLVHDDIEDGDDLRYGKETIHAKYGIPVAINTGDLLIGEGYRLIAESNLETEKITECLKVISGGHRSMAVGQGNELMARRNNSIPDIGEMMKIFENKTGEAFRVSLLTGAVAGSADRDALELLAKFSSLIGIAYQLKDDLEDITDEPEGNVMRNPSAMISLLAEKSDNGTRETILEAIRKNNMDLLRGLIKKYRVTEQIDKMIGEYLELIDDCLTGLKNIPLKLALYEIVGKTFSKYL
jgi:geranylgeranyl diphosphate synthase, type II